MPIWNIVSTKGGWGSRTCNSGNGRYTLKLQGGNCSGEARYEPNHFPWPQSGPRCPHRAAANVAIVLLESARWVSCRPDVKRGMAHRRAKDVNGVQGRNGSQGDGHGEVEVSAICLPYLGFAPAVASSTWKHESIQNVAEEKSKSAQPCRHKRRNRGCCERRQQRVRAKEFVYEGLFVPVAIVCVWHRQYQIVA